MVTTLNKSTLPLGINPNTLFDEQHQIPAETTARLDRRPPNMARPVDEPKNPQNPTSANAFANSSRNNETAEQRRTRLASEQAMGYAMLASNMNQARGNQPANTISNTEFSTLLEKGFEFLGKFLSKEQVDSIRNVITGNLEQFRDAFKSQGVFSALTDNNNPNSRISVSTAAGTYRPTDAINLSSPADVRLSDTYRLRHSHPVTGKESFHHGVDYATAMNTPIGAADAGRVIFYGTVNGYGNVAVLDHGNGIYTQYAHLNRMANGFNVGDVVQKGDKFCLSGNTGRSSGPHLHFEVWVKQGNDIHTVNPQAALGADLTNTSSPERLALFGAGKNSAFTNRAETTFASNQYNHNMA